MPEMVLKVLTVAAAGRAVVHTALVLVVLVVPVAAVLVLVSVLMELLVETAAQAAAAVALAGQVKVKPNSGVKLEQVVHKVVLLPHVEHLIKFQQ